MKDVKEEAPTTAAGNGAVAGIGVGPNGEPPKKLKKFSQFIKRWSQ